MFTPIVKSWLLKTIEHGIAAVCVALAAHGASQAQVASFKALLNPESIVAVLLWLINYFGHSVWAHMQTNKLVNAVASGAKGASVMAGAAPITAVALCLFCLTAKADSVTNNGGVNSINLPIPVLTSLGVSSSVSTAVNDLYPSLEALVPYLTNGFTNLIVDIGPNYSAHYFGFNADAQLPINPGLSAGVGALYAEKLWFVELPKIQVGVNYTDPIFHRVWTSYANDGVSLGVKTAALGNYAEGGEFTHIDLGRGWSLNLLGAVANDTSLPKPIYKFNAALTFPFKK